MPNSWNITITEIDQNTVAFTPTIAGAQQGQPLGVNKGDNITWDNTTNRDLELQLVSITPPPPNPAVPPSGFETIKIPAGKVSAPIFNVTQAAGKTITYSCKTPSTQPHSIVVS